MGSQYQPLFGKSIVYKSIEEMVSIQRNPFLVEEAIPNANLVLSDHWKNQIRQWISSKRSSEESKYEEMNADWKHLFQVYESPLPKKRLGKP
jgi:hypothetical protein